MEALGEACPLEVVQDEACQAVVVAGAAPQILGAQHGGVLSHEGHGGPAASGTYLDGASRPVEMGEDVCVRVQGVQPPGFLLKGAHGLQPQEAWVVGAWLGVSPVEGLQEAALGVGRSQEEACLVEEAQIPMMTLQDWGQRAAVGHLQTADEGDRPGRVDSGPPEAVRLLSHDVRPWSPS